jgi:hypothetical protein
MNTARTILTGQLTLDTIESLRKLPPKTQVSIQASVIDAADQRAMDLFAANLRAQGFLVTRNSNTVFITL